MAVALSSETSLIGKAEVSNLSLKMKQLEDIVEETKSHLSNHSVHSNNTQAERSKSQNSMETSVISICSTITGKHSPLDEGENAPGVQDKLKKKRSTFYAHPFPPGFDISLAPKSREEWLDFLVWLIKQRIKLKHLGDIELKHVIEIARGQLYRRPQEEEDPVIPTCYYWDETKVAEWIDEVGFPELQHAFLNNFINGRRLLGVDASALCQMGIQDWDTIRELTSNIRGLFGFTRPNSMRPLLRIPPFETFLTKFRIHNGPNYDLLTFKEFCKKYKYAYSTLTESGNKNALIPCTCSIAIRRYDDQESSLSERSDDEDSLADAPSVEFQVRHQFIRSQVIEELINDMIEMVFTTKPSEHALPYIDDLIDKILNGALLDLGFGDPNMYTKERVQFAAQIALALLAEMQDTADAMTDINILKSQIQTEVSPEELGAMRDAAGTFMEDLGPIAALLALNQLSLEGIFKHEPEFEQFVDKIIEDAEKATNDLVPTAVEFVDSVLAEAKLRTVAMKEFPYFSLEAVRAARDIAEELIDDILTEAVRLASEVTSPQPPNLKLNPTKKATKLQISAYPVLIDNEAGMRSVLKEKTLKKLGKVTGEKKLVKGQKVQVHRIDTGDTSKDESLVDPEAEIETMVARTGLRMWNKVTHKLTPRIRTIFRRRAPRYGSVSPLRDVKGHVGVASGDSSAIRPKSAPQPGTEGSWTVIPEVVSSKKKRCRRLRSAPVPSTSARDVWKEVQELSGNKIITASAINSERRKTPSFKTIVHQWTSAQMKLETSEASLLSSKYKNLACSTSIQILDNVFKQTLKYTLKLEKTNVESKPLNEPLRVEAVSGTGIFQKKTESHEKETKHAMLSTLKQKVKKNMIGTLRKALENAGLQPENCTPELKDASLSQISEETGSNLDLKT